jgi:hypothetical protein
MKKLVMLLALASVTAGASAQDRSAAVERGAAEAAYANAQSAHGCGLPGAVRDTPGVPLVCSSNGKWIAMKTETAEDRAVLNPAAFGCIILGPDGRKLNLTPASGSGEAIFFPKGTSFTSACLSRN